MAEQERFFMDAPRADDERIVIKALTAYRLFTTSIHAVYVDERCAPDQLIHGPAETLAGHLNHGEVVMHPDTAARYARHFLVIPYRKEVPTVAADIETKVFTRQRVEYWITTGTYHGDGARFEETEQAYAWAKQRLVNAGVIKEGQSAEGHIRVRPHDEHVIVYIEFDEEQTR